MFLATFILTSTLASCPPMEIIKHPDALPPPPAFTAESQEVGCIKNFGQESHCPLVALVHPSGHISVICGAESGIDDPQVLEMLKKLREIAK